MEAALIDVQLAEVFDSIYMVVCVTTVFIGAGLCVAWWKKSR